MKLQRYQQTPILAPNPAHAWESLITTNPAAWLDERDGEVKLLYRAAGHDLEHVVRFGLAVSKDGCHFERTSDQPTFGPSADGVDAGGVEDPRLVKFGDWYFMTYASKCFPKGQYFNHSPEHKAFRAALAERFALPEEAPAPFRDNQLVSCLAMTRDFKSWIRCGVMTNPTEHDHDVIIFPEKIGGRFAVLTRPLISGPQYGIDAPAIWLAQTDNLLDVSDRRVIAGARCDWEGNKIGANCPPIKTDKGWLMIYHGAGKDRTYRLGAMLLDLVDPTVVLHRTPEPIFEPELEWEIKGCHNWAGGVVFPCGNIVKDGQLMVYYGAADKYVGLATVDLAAFVNFLTGCPAM